jgi:putative acetyltransferase
MYFLKEARGAGQGERMLRHCLQAARSLGYRSCYLETLRTMTSAMKLYERVGFKPRSAPLGNTGHFGCDRWYDLPL